MTLFMYILCGLAGFFFCAILPNDVDDLIKRGIGKLWGVILKLIGMGT